MSASAHWTVEDAERYLLGLELFGMRFGLDRMRRLMTTLDQPERRYDTIHVVGTNGKSSTTRMIAAILQRHGLRTGAYTSPHLLAYRERVLIDERELAPPEFSAAVARAARAARDTAAAKAAGSRSRSATWMRSANETRCGDVYAPVRTPWPSRMAATIRAVEDLPFVPTTWIEANFS